jgi:chromosome segregation ATPase
MNIQGGALEFDILLNDGKINSALEETKKRMQGFSSSMTEGGAKMEAAYNDAAKQIEKGFQMTGTAIKINQQAIVALESKYKELGAAAGEAFAKGKDSKYSQLANQQSNVQSEINQRKQIVSELQKADAALVQYNKDLEDQKNKADNASNAQVKFRTQLLNVKNEMMQLEQAGKKNTAEYARLTEEAKRLANAMYSANQQIKTLTTTKGATLQGFMSGISGLSGAFTAAQGAIGLFADKNEELQKIMLKVQSLMSITMGLQAVSATLHETSAFRIAILTKVQAAYNGCNSNCREKKYLCAQNKNSIL